MKAKNLNINEIRKIGLNALNRALGPKGMIRFIHDLDSGSGDYTKNRHKWLDQFNVNSIYKEIKSK